MLLSPIVILFCTTILYSDKARTSNIWANFTLVEDLALVLRKKYVSSMVSKFEV